jgi:hypothetical protein
MTARRAAAWTLGLLATGGCTARLLLGQPSPKIPKIAVTTYHYDNLRTGWNSHERILNPKNASTNPIRPGGVQRLKVVPLDDTVYAQPLIVPDLTINGAKHDVVYVVTEHNTVYAIDANDGTILKSHTLGDNTPDNPSSVPMSFCWNSGPYVGIESTPVIDLPGQTMYLISYQMSFGNPAYFIYSLDLATLDRKQRVEVKAQHTLSDGSTYNFDPAAQRQRAALLLEDGNVYAAFTSFCDSRNGPRARGWLLGWRASDLQLLPHNILVNQDPKAYLSTSWMSGYGPAAIAGHIYFATGNSAPGRPSAYNPSINPSESVIKVSADLTRILDFFTPSNVANPTPPHDCNLDLAGLDACDSDLGSGGVMIIPDQPGPVPRMATVAGKSGDMYLLNRADSRLGGYNPYTENIVGKYPIGSCYCGPSYYLNNIVSSGGNDIGVFQINTSPSTGLTQIHFADLNADDPQFGTRGDGFFTTVSSNGAANVIIWAVSQREVEAEPPHFPRLYAYQPVAGTWKLKSVFASQVAGRWDVPRPSPPPDGAHSNIVPVVANGHVYVASYKELDIFGLVPVIPPNQ